MSLNVNYRESFQNRHIGPDANETNEMLSKIGVNSVDQLIFPRRGSNFSLSLKVTPPYITLVIFQMKFYNYLSLSEEVRITKSQPLH